MSLQADRDPVGRSVTRPYEDGTLEYVAPDDSAVRPPQIPGYEVLRSLGQGGMGAVFLARHLELKRLVALKVLLHGDTSGESARRRFSAESEALAAVGHPGILHVYDRGTYDGLPYFAMEYCSGGSLADRVKDAPLAIDTGAQVVERLARAVAAAHEKGVLHRDLKPGNVFFAADGSPRIGDFGLAKRLDDDSENITRPGAVIGTPSYMAPEQAQGKAVGTAADVYSLGAILYRVTSGRPPFIGANSTATIQMVIAGDPASPRLSNPAIPRDLETICLKCLQRDPKSRYGSAAELADDLARFSRHEPILARPTSKIERAGKWIRRHPARAGFVASFAALIATLVVGATIVALQAKKSAADLAGYNTDLLREQRETQAALRESQRQSARLAIDRGLSLCEQGDVGSGLVSFSAGLPHAIAAEADDLETVIRLNISAWELESARLVAVDTVSPGLFVSQMQLSPDRRFAALAYSDRSVHFRDLRTGIVWRQPHPTPVYGMEFTADGKLLMVRCQREVYVRSAVTGETVIPPITVTSPAAALRGDGKQLAVFEGKEIRLHPIGGDGKPMAISTPGTPTILSYRPGRAELWAAVDRQLLRWNCESGRSTSEPIVHETLVLCLSFCSDGSAIVCGTSAGRIHHWTPDAINRSFVSEDLGGPIRSVSFNSSGTIYSGITEGGVLHVRSTTTGDSLARPFHESFRVTCSAFHPNGEEILVGARDGRIRSWHLKRGSPTGPILHLPQSVTSCAISVDDQVVANDLALRIWVRPVGTRIGEEMDHGGDVHVHCFDPDGKQLVLAGTDGGVSRWSLADVRQQQEKSNPHRGVIHTIGWIKPGRLVSIGVDSMVVIQNLDGGSRHTWKAHTGSTLGGAIDAIREFIVTGGSDGTVRLWDARTHGEIGEPIKVGTPVSAVAIRPDGKAVLTASGPRMQLWDLETRREIGSAVRSAGSIMTVGFSPDGVTAIAGGYDSSLRLRNGCTGESLDSTSAYGELCQSFAVDPFSRFLIPAGLRTDTRIHRIATDDAVGAVIRHRDHIRSVACSPDGRTVLTGSRDGSARRHHLPSGLPVGPELKHSSFIRSVSFSTNGLRIACSGNRFAAVWSCPAPMSESPDAIRRHVERLTGLAIDNTGTSRATSAQAWHE